LREAWPGIVCSNYATSTCYIVSQGASGKKCGSETKLYGDVMAPVLYSPDKWTSPSLKRTQSNWRSLTVSASLTYLSHLRSCSGRPIVPWIHLPGQAHSDGPVTTPGLTQELMERAHQTYGIDEWLIWSDEKTGAAVSNWNDLYEVLVTTYGQTN
jgi:diadenosine tetraphosphatase ApaH/serine/threonine PP2A family protein phosphatase